MKNNLFLETDPALFEAMIKTNVHPFVYMSKYAVKHFLEKRDVHAPHKNAMTFTSSMAAICWMPFTATYSGTKSHNFVLGRLLSQ